MPKLVNSYTLNTVGLLYINHTSIKWFFIKKRYALCHMGHVSGSRILLMKENCFIQRVGFLVRFCRWFISAPCEGRRCLHVGAGRRPGVDGWPRALLCEEGFVRDALAAAQVPLRNAGSSAVPCRVCVPPDQNPFLLEPRLSLWPQGPGP